MIFRNGTHAEEWAAAIYRADAHRDDDTANPYFGASLFLITAVPGLYDRVKEQALREIMCGRTLSHVAVS